MTNDDNVVSTIQGIMSNTMHILCNDAVLLGAPISDESAVDTVLHSKFRQSSEKLVMPRMLYFFFKTFFGMPKLFTHYAQVDSDGTHGLTCRKSVSFHMRHNAVNDLIIRVLVSSNVPSLLEPSLLCRDDGKHPDF